MKNAKKEIEVIEDVVSNTKAFGVFVGFINKSSEGKMSVKEALLNPILIKLFEKNQEIIVSLEKRKKIKTGPKTTKTLSHAQVNKSKSYRKIIELLTLRNKPMGRYEMAMELGARASSVSGRVCEMIQAGFLEVCGTALDHETNRYVELVRIVKAS